MPDEIKNTDPQEIVLDQFLLETIISLQTTLASLNKDSEEKSEMIGSICDNLQAIAFGMKEIRERQARFEHDEQAVAKLVSELAFKIEALGTKIESEINTHIKETKYSVQALRDDLVEIKVDNKVAKKKEKKDKEDGEESGEEKKITVASFFSNLWEAIKNIKTILMIILTIALVIGAILSGQPIMESIIKPIVSMFSGS